MVSAESDGERLPIVIAGAAGRMGQALIRIALASGCKVVGAIEHGASSSVGRDAGEIAGIGTLGVSISADVGSALLGASCLVDFSGEGALVGLLQQASRASIPVVSGTTNLGDAAFSAMDVAARKIPVFWAPNMSVGVYVLGDLVRRAAATLASFDVEIVETHHRHKVDAPSGTAKRLLEDVASVREARKVTGRDGVPGARLADEVGVLALRGGDVVGDHSVHFLGEGERLELTHRATSRDLFARGALTAAHRLVGRPPGRYGMADLFGDRS